MTGPSGSRSTRAIGVAGGRAAGELAGLVQPLRLVARLPGLLRRRPPDRSRVVVLPGRSFGDATTAPLRAYLRAQGHDARGWGLGRNDRDARSLVAPMVEELERRTGGRDAPPVVLVGQSMGGFIAREVARHRPDLVRRVITLGSPLYSPTSSDRLTVPVTAIWSDADRVVPPGWAIDRDPATEHVQVRSTHFAMGVDPDVWRIVADRLAIGDEAAPATTTDPR